MIELDRFIEFFRVDPHYFARTLLLIPDNSAKPYALLRKVLEKTGLAVIGKVTMSTKERVVLIHYYQNAIVATTLRYPDEVTDEIRGCAGERREPKKPAVKRLMEELRATAESLQRRHSISVLRFLPCFFRISPLSAKSYDRYMYTIRNMAHT